MLLPYWPLLLICLTATLTIALWMTWLEKRFRYINSEGNEESFSILDVQMPATEVEMIKVLSGLKPAARKALRAHLLIDFLFMPAFYGTIALICGIVGEKTGMGIYFFWLMGALQAFAWLFDVLENVYCLRKLNRPIVTEHGFKTYRFNVNTKFAICITALAVTLPVVFYCWLSGDYWPSTLRWGAWFAGEIVLFAIIAGKIKAAD